MYWFEDKYFAKVYFEQDSKDIRVWLLQKHDKHKQEVWEFCMGKSDSE